MTYNYWKEKLSDDLDSMQRIIFYLNCVFYFSLYVIGVNITPRDKTKIGFLKQKSTKGNIY